MSENILKEAASLPEETVRIEFKQLGGKGDGPVWLMRLAVTYERLITYARSKGNPISQTIWRRYRLARALDAAGIRKESEFLTPKYDDSSNEYQGGHTMAKKTGSKKEARITASSILIKILGAAKVMDDDSIIKEVKSETGSTKFDASQLAWYKWKYRQGKLKGMDGKQHVINQGSPKKEVKKVKKKIIIKDRRTKESAAA